jgi:hypothetical protein
MASLQINDSPVRRGGLKSGEPKANGCRRFSVSGTLTSTSTN